MTTQLISTPAKGKTTTVGPLTFTRNGNFVSVTSFYEPIGIDVVGGGPEGVIGVLPEDFRPPSIVTSLLVSSNDLLPFASLYIRPDGTIVVRSSHTTITATDRPSLTAFTYAVN